MQEGRLEQIKQGFVADLLILSGNTLDDIEIFDKSAEFLLAMIKDARVVSSQLSSSQIEV